MMQKEKEKKEHKIPENSILIEEENIEENVNVDMTIDDAPLNEASNSMNMETKFNEYGNQCKYNFESLYLFIILGIFQYSHWTSSNDWEII